jgi:hypothetical protein
MLNVERGKGSVQSQWSVVSVEFGDESWEFSQLIFYELELTSAQSNL